MCGIYGIVSKSNHIIKNVIKGLEKEEYRGYDSFGIALFASNSFYIYKDKGRLCDLVDNISLDLLSSCGIGHTRWATHGEVNKENSHPHISNNGLIALVHNGVINNYESLKKKYLSSYTFSSSTDSEVIVNLIQQLSLHMDMIAVLSSLKNYLEGSYTILFMNKEEPNKIYFLKNKTPLLIGKTPSGFELSSDTVAFSSSSSYISLNDFDYGYVTKERLVLFSKENRFISPSFITYNKKINDVNKGKYPHYMLKEIEEENKVVSHLMSSFIYENKYTFSPSLLETIKNSSSILILGCGTSYHAGLIAKVYFEQILHKRTMVTIASEAIYEAPLIDESTFIIVLSQSGETLDVINSLNNKKLKSNKSLSITNSLPSTIGRITTYNIDLMIGKEIAVASTKAYVGEIVLLYMLVNALKDIKCYQIDELKNLEYSINIIKNKHKKVILLAKGIHQQKDIFYIGKGLGYYCALESALKFKEVSLNHVEGLPSGELKHGTLALIQKGTPVIAFIDNKVTESIIRSNLKEIESRGGIPFVFSLKDFSKDSDTYIIANSSYYLSPVLFALVSQYLAYYSALYNGRDIDKPVNLAKSVTVE